MSTEPKNNPSPEIPDPAESWARVELYRWEHGYLPGEAGMPEKPLNETAGFLKMAEAMEKCSMSGDFEDMPPLFNLITVMKYMGTKFSKPGLIGRPQAGDKEYLREAALAAEAKLPDNHGFFLLVVPFGEGPNNRMTYTSSIDRASAIKVMKEWLFKIGETEDWMPHIR